MVPTPHMHSRAVLASLLLVLLTAAPAAGWELALPEHDYGPSFFLAVDKASQSLFVMRQQSPLTVEESFSCATGQILGDKLVEGDMRTPEGLYWIDRRNPNSAFHLSLGISYPNAGDLAYASTKGKMPGGDIFIHGEAGRPRSGDWTEGCIAVTDDEIEEIYAMVKNGTPILIRP